MEQNTSEIMPAPSTSTSTSSAEPVSDRDVEIGSVRWSRKESVYFIGMTSTGEPVSGRQIERGIVNWSRKKSVCFVEIPQPVTERNLENGSENYDNGPYDLLAQWWCLLGIAVLIIAELLIIVFAFRIY
uniref:AsIV-cont00076-ORF1 n=1 Tax=Apophua simplicipes ichnovirus TaxID=1329648 RepID=S5DT27_9VIRU|nr:AsIV-cont00076-ORF1 [Apophua simplicipes ichnovirus]